MSETTATRKAALWVSMVFVLGAALGGVMGYMFARHSVSASTTPLSEPERRARKVEEISRELNLTDAQRQQLDSTLTKIHAQYQAIHEQSDAQIDQVRQKGRDELRAILTPEQKPKFEEFLKRMDEERKRKGPSAPR